jgi:hypothetical protein
MSDAEKVQGQKNGAHDWNRTSDLLLTKEVLYRLSYVSTANFSKQSIDVINSNALSTTPPKTGAGDGNRTRTISLEG